MMLAEYGKLQLADPVSKHLPALKGLSVSVARVNPQFARVTYGLVPAEREMSVHDLLRHTSGLAYGEITQNGPVRDAYAKAGLYLQGSATTIPGTSLPPSRWSAWPGRRSRSSRAPSGSTA